MNSEALKKVEKTIKKTNPKAADLLTTEGANNSDDEDAIDSEREEIERVDGGTRFKYTPYDCFKDLVNDSPLFKIASAYGRNIIPLSVVGMYFNYAGNHLLNYIYNTYSKKVFHAGHRVISVQLLTNGDILTTAIKKLLFIKKNDG